MQGAPFKRIQKNKEVKLKFSVNKPNSILNYVDAETQTQLPT